MEWVKQNWFKLVIAFFLVISLILSILFYSDYRKESFKQSQTSADIETKSAVGGNEVPETDDQYVVTFDDDGNPVTWEQLEIAVVILKDTVARYSDGLDAIEETVSNEEEIVIDLYTLIARTTDPVQKQKLKTLVGYSETYIEAGEESASLMKKLISAYQGLENAVSERKRALYLYYSDEIDTYETQKEDVLNNYLETQTRKQQYAGELLSL